MFGLSMREVLTTAIVNACINCKDVYKDAIIKNMEALNKAKTDEDTYRLTLFIRKEYLDAVWNTVVSSFSISAPTVFSRIQFISTTPSICGYGDITMDNGIMAGGLYAICYYALKNKKAASKDCIKLNHLQTDIMNQVLFEIENET